MAIEGKLYIKKQPRGWSAPVDDNPLINVTKGQQAHSAKAHFHHR